jgi:UDP-glucuronate 4-epimerase
MQAAVLRTPYHIPFGGRLDLQYADDVAKTFIQAALAAPEGAAVHKLRGTIVSVDEVIPAIEAAWPEATDLITRASEPIRIRPELDGSTLRAFLGDVPRTDFEDAVAPDSHALRATHGARPVEA